MARDIIHHAVKNALIKDGWLITDDPFRIDFEEFTLFADLAAKRSADTGETIIIEVKSFVGRSFVEKLQKAFGAIPDVSRLFRRSEQSISNLSCRQ